MKEVFDEIMSGIPLWAKAMFCIVMAMIAFLLLSSCSALQKYYPQDNLFEEITEEVILQKTGLDLDLSPGSAEKK